MQSGRSGPLHRLSNRPPQGSNPPPVGETPTPADRWVDRPAREPRGAGPSASARSPRLGPLLPAGRIRFPGSQARPNTSRQRPAGTARPLEEDRSRAPAQRTPRCKADLKTSQPQFRAGVCRLSILARLSMTMTSIPAPRPSPTTRRTRSPPSLFFVASASPQRAGPAPPRARPTRPRDKAPTGYAPATSPPRTPRCLGFAPIAAKWPRFR
ncbi:hypothetical protein EV662_10690 [Rhodovulum marinum]|uniref:Uncharacterized protein n=1 Tax=Rhodovulum marinum TaxID=320662 RepID=A0A4R2Q2L0_9RHOB|nr:hypothetical protein EV662_10690 [Rhodovulum marinum]